MMQHLKVTSNTHFFQAFKKLKRKVYKAVNVFKIERKNKENNFRQTVPKKMNKKGDIRAK
jgi:hypothetical protein